MPLDTLVKTRLPYFGYQLQFASGEVEKVVTSKQDIRQFLLAMFGGRTTDGEPGVDVMSGVLLDKLSDVQMTPLMSEEVGILSFYYFNFLPAQINA